MIRPLLLPSLPVRAAVAAVVPPFAPTEKAEAATLEAMTVLPMAHLLRMNTVENMTGPTTTLQPDDFESSPVPLCVAHAATELAMQAMSQRTKIVKAGPMVRPTSAAETWTWATELQDSIGLLPTLGTTEKKIAIRGVAYDIVNSLVSVAH